MNIQDGHTFLISKICPYFVSLCLKNFVFILTCILILVIY